MPPPGMRSISPSQDSEDSRVPILESRSALKTFNPDLVHGTMPLAGVYSRSLRKGIGAKTILTNHSISILYNFDHLWHSPPTALPRQLIGCGGRSSCRGQGAALQSPFTTRSEGHPTGLCQGLCPERKVYDGKSVRRGRFSYRKGISLLLSDAGGHQPQLMH
jgi:hypothetical protein